MSKLTLEDAISHCLEVAEQNEKKAEYRPRMDYYDEIESRTDCLECAADHRQLAEWLIELKELQEENKVLTRDCLRLIKSNDKLRKRLKRMAEYKRLLKSATGIIKDVDCNEDYLCDECEYRAKCDGGFSFYWRYADEAEKLLNDEKINNVE